MSPAYASAHIERFASCRRACTTQRLIHADGSTNVYRTGSFTGTVCGQPATLEMQLAANGNLNDSFVAGTYVVRKLEPSGSTFGHGSGTLAGEAGGAGVYEGQVHCD